MNKEALGEYVQRVMRQKNLSLRDIEAACDNELTNSYISRISNGKVSNLTLETLVVLAKGLGVDPYDVFAAWYDRPRKSGTDFDAYFLLDLLHRLIENPQAIELLQIWLSLPEKDKAGVFEMAEYIKKKSAKPKGRKGRPRK